MDVAARAVSARRVLVEQFWDPRTRLFRIRAGPMARLAWWLPVGHWHYWWQAHALDCLLDGLDAGDPGSADLAVDHVTGIVNRTGGDVTHNDFIDDLAWLGLATLRAHRLGVIDARLPRTLAEAVSRGHDPDLGGFPWRFGDDFHNVPASAPAAMLLAGAAELAGQPDWVEVARDTAEWLHRTVVDGTGLVWDGCRPRAGSLVPEGPLWSYNIGTVAGLDVTLAALSAPVEADRLLARAGRVVRAGTAALRSGCVDIPAARIAAIRGSTSPPTGSAPWRDELGEGSNRDPLLFRGILARYAADLVLADPSRTGDVAADLMRQADAAWSAREDRGLVGPSWGQPTTPGKPDAGRVPQPQTWLASHLSGTLTLAAAGRIAAAG